MKQTSYLLSLLCCITLFGAAFAQNSTNNITFAPPPPVNTTMLFTLNYSIVDSRFIGSDRIQDLELTQTTVSGNTTTTFKINYFNRSQASNLQSVNISNLPGTWSQLISSQSTLSCSLVFESTNSTYSLLRFSNQTVLQIVLQGNKTKFPTEMASLSNTDIQSKVMLGQMCNIISFNKTPYLFNPANTSNPWVSLNVPNPTLFLGGSPDFSFVITNLTLYQFNMTNNSYIPVNIMLPNYQKFDIKNSQNQLILIGSNSSTADNLTFNVTQTVLALVVIANPQNLTATVISSDNITGVAKSPSIPVNLSPQLTKICFFFKPPNATAPQIVIKSVDYMKQTVSNFTFVNPNEFMDNLKAAGPKQLNIGDNFLLVSNISGVALNSTLPVVKLYYQYIGQNIITIRTTVIPANATSNITNISKAMIDPNFPNNLIVIQAYNLANGVKYFQIELGSLAANNRVLPPVTPPILNFTIPTFTSQYPSDTFLQWIYLDSSANSNTSTKITTYTFNNTMTSNIQITNFSLPGNWTILAQNQQCKFLSQIGAQNLSIWILDMQTRQQRLFADVTSLLSGVTINSTTKVALSLGCDRFSVDNKIYTIIPSNNYTALQTFMIVTNNMTTFTWTSSDLNLTTVIIGSAVWRYQPTSASNAFVKILDSPYPLFSNATLYANPGRLLITGANSTCAQAFAFIDQNGTLQSIFNWTFQNYQNTPKISVSMNLTKIMIIGPAIPPNATQAAPKIDIFFIAYMNATGLNVTAPPNLVLDPLNTYLTLSDQFLYARQTSTSNSNTSALQEFIYYFDQDLYLKQALVTNISTTTNITWKKTLIFNAPNNTFLVLEEDLQTQAITSDVILNARQVSPGQANLNSNNGGINIAGVIVNGVINLCSPGCSDCSSGTCSSCFDGNVMDSTSFVCLRCDTNCKSCYSLNTTNCSSCFPRSYLSGTSCLPCDPSCFTCAGNSTNCTTCPPGQFMSGGQIAPCMPFCFNCSSTTTCVTCMRGFVVTSNNTCRQCVISCSSCNASNITQCTSCADGLQLVNGACISCPDNCKNCNSGICSVCFPGFQANSAGQCVLQCSPTCATCADNKPTVCLSCYGGAIYNSANYTCSINITCNTDSSCTSCASGFNYIFVTSIYKCLACPSIDNCIQCSGTTSSLCVICNLGFYVNGTGGCSNCSTNCTACQSSTICTSCAVGYTLPMDQSSGSCLPCTSPCVTCIGASTFCSSCITGFSKVGWKCLNNTYVGFTIVLNADPSYVLTNVDSIINGLLSVAQQGNGSITQGSITFTSFQSGSTIASGTATDVSAGALTLTAGQTLGGITINSASFTQYGTTNSSSQSTITNNTDSKNIGLYIGLGVGIPLAIILIVVIACVIYRKRKQQQVSPNSPGNMVQLNNTSPIKANDSEFVTAKENVYPGNHGEKASSHQVWDKEISLNP